MTERFITVLLTLFISVFALRLDATSIVILEEKGAYGDFLQNIQQWKENFRDVLTGNVAGKKKLGAFEVAYVKGHRLLTRAEVLRDVDKHDQAEGKKWHELTLEAGVAVPWMLPLATLLGPVNVAIEANGKVAATKQYRIVMPDVLSLAEDEQSKAAEQTIDLQKHITKIYKIIALPLTATRLRAMLPAGSEISSVGEKTLLIKVGPRLNAVGAALKANTHVLLSSLFKSSLKVLARIGERTFVNYRVATADTRDFALEAKLTLGLTFINTSLFDKLLSSEIITAQIAREQEKKLVYDFIYDLDHPTAQQALGKALLGDLSASQDIATFRSDPADYQGVTIMEKSSDLLLDVVKKGRIAFTTGDKLLTPHLQELLGQELSGSLLDFSRNAKESSVETTSVNAVEEREEVASFKYSYDRNNELLLGLVAANVSNINIDSRAVLASIVSSGQGLQEVMLNRLNFDYAYHEKKNSQQIVANFFAVARNVLAANQRTLTNVIDAVQGSKQCSSKDARFTISGVLHDRAVRNLLRYQPAEVWTGIAKVLGIEPASAFRYEKTRAKAIAKLPRAHRKLLEKFTKQALPFWSEASDLNDKKATAEKIRDMFAAMKGDPFLLELLIFLASADYRQAKDPDRFSQGVNVSVALTTPDCNLKWSQRGKLSYAL